MRDAAASAPARRLLDSEADSFLPAATARPRLVAEPGPDDASPPLRSLVERMLALLGEDPEREGLAATPERVERSLTWLTSGYGRTAADAVGGALFAESHDGLVVVRDIEMYSLCEHHMLPFFGRVHVGYVPDGRVVGLSKLP